MTMSRTLRTGLATSLSLALAGGAVGLSAGPGAAAGAPRAAKPAKFADDFNGDGIRDYVVPGDGRFQVTYGAARGIGTKTTTFTQSTPGIPGTAGSAGGYGDAFGSQLATGDFNRDGYADVAAGDPTEKAGRPARGAVTLIWGSKAGLTGTGAARIPLPDTKVRTGFGGVLAAGDFTGDGRVDLAVMDTWVLHLYRGGFTKAGKGGTVSEYKPYEAGLHGVLGLAAGRVDKDGITDLYAVGQGQANAGPTSAALLFKGGSSLKRGKLTTYNRAFHHPTDPVVADFDRNGYGDLALGEGREDGAGALAVLRGGANGPVSTYRVNQGSPGVATGLTPGDAFATSISAGDVDRDGYPDLAVGVPQEKVGAVENAGGVHLLRGSRTGLTGAGSQWFTRETAGVPGTASRGDALGQFVRLRDADRDGHLDLLAGGDYPPGLVLRGGKKGIGTEGAGELRLRPSFPQ
ncbi:FG-GAP and VCBS repeat-containing protein [Streptomyces yaizuensis]|uniref:FG-GAP and VCBS repeat-containing protein n=1 Tax=Streptomyces yaizuensis TaxID=2989713 RepID=A0ABQ5P431_9ACTN|nr:FG-GAP and VCBS repeat-containing protein [Streptomyces sp. YSPA8]GLF97361.1 FG-GAP and VCBS repeat-containing protein [Streptomyces sp. YSPA8]